MLLIQAFMLQNRNAESFRHSVPDSNFSQYVAWLHAVRFEFFANVRHIYAQYTIVLRVCIRAPYIAHNVIISQYLTRIAGKKLNYTIFDLC